MKKMTNRELKSKIKKLKADFAKEFEMNGNSKRAIFLNATINVYSGELRARGL